MEPVFSSFSVKLIPREFLRFQTTVQLKSPNVLISRLAAALRLGEPPLSLSFAPPTEMSSIMTDCDNFSDLRRAPRVNELRWCVLCSAPLFAFIPVTPLDIFSKELEI